MKRLLFVSLLITFTSMNAMCKKKKAFIQSHQLPDETIAIADTLFAKEHVQRALAKGNKQLLCDEGFSFLATRGNLIMEHESLPGWVIKHGGRFKLMFNNIGRIKVAEKIERYIKRKQITSIVVPNKYLYHLPGRSKKLKNNNYLVFSEKLPIKNRHALRELPQKTIDDACRVIRRFALHDASVGNFCLLDDGKIAIVDTEPTTRTGKGLWFVLDNPLTRLVQGLAGEYIFRRSVRATEAA